MLSCRGWSVEGWAWGWVKGGGNYNGAGRKGGEGWCPKGDTNPEEVGGEKGGGPKGEGGPKFRAFFPSPAAKFVLFFPLWGSSRGILVVFEAPGRSNVRVWSSLVEKGAKFWAVPGEGRSKQTLKPTPTHEMKQYPCHSDNTQHNTTQHKSNSIWPKSVRPKSVLAKVGHTTETLTLAKVGLAKVGQPKQLAKVSFGQSQLAMTWNSGFVGVHSTRTTTHGRNGNVSELDLRHPHGPTPRSS